MVEVVSDSSAILRLQIYSLYINTLPFFIFENWYIRQPGEITVTLAMVLYSYYLFQASAGMLMRSSLFWDITQRRVVIFCRRFGTTYGSHIQGSRSPKNVSIFLRNSWPLKMGPIRYAETSVKYYDSTLRNISEEHRSHVTSCVSNNVTYWRHYVII
jgi:hypothetical protein